MGASCLEPSPSYKVPDPARPDLTSAWSKMVGYKSIPQTGQSLAGPDKGQEIPGQLPWRLLLLLQEQSYSSGRGSSVARKLPSQPQLPWLLGVVCGKQGELSVRRPGSQILPHCKQFSSSPEPQLGTTKDHSKGIRGVTWSDYSESTEGTRKRKGPGN